MSTLNINLGNDFGTDLSSRNRAGSLRESIIIAIESSPVPGTLVIFDLSRVRSISHSFADELFAILVAEQGDEWFRHHIRVENVSPIVRETILEAIQLRLDECGVSA